jgi:hypothetical protein
MQSEVVSWPCPPAVVSRRSNRFAPRHAAQTTGLWLASITALGLLYANRVQAACEPCTTFLSGIIWGETSINALSEASGIASSARNSGVLWTHNDGSRKRVFAVSTNGATLSNFSFDESVDDVEDMAVGPGPAAGVSYLYFGDIGGNSHSGDKREDVQIIRIPEPAVDLAWASSPRSSDFAGVESFTLVYPDGEYDAETLLVDPITADVLVVTKENNSARVYRANLNAAANGSTLDLTLVQTVTFAKASGGDISADGKLIALRREDAAMVWTRCDNEAIGTALGRAGQTIPVIGTPTEENGEAIAFLRDGSGYVTISEGDDQPIHLFRSNCAQPPIVRISTSGTLVRIEFDAVAGRIYALEARDSFVSSSWSSTGQSLQPTADGPHRFEVEKSKAKTFYRVVAQ